MLRYGCLHGTPSIGVLLKYYKLYLLLLDVTVAIYPCIHFTFLCHHKVITSTGIVIEVDILERVDTDPPDTPTLDSTLTTMQDHINTGKFSVS